MNKIELSYQGTVFNKIAGNEKKAMYYNEELNNLLIVTTDEKAEIEAQDSEFLTQELLNGEVDEEDIEYYQLDENGKVIVEMDDEEFNDTIEDAIGFIVGERWDDLCLVAEYISNTVTLIHKPYHTTTDYIINYDLDPRAFIIKPIAEAIENFYAQLPEEMIAYKTIEVINGVAYHYGEIPEEVLEAHFE